MSDQQRRDKIRSAASQAAALAAARREIKRWNYGSQERRLEHTSRDFKLGTV